MMTLAGGVYKSTITAIKTLQQCASESVVDIYGNN